MIDGLQRAFGVTERVGFEQDQDGQCVCVMHAPGSTARVALRGAHVQSWKCADQPNDMFWMSSQRPVDPEKPRRGGIPICWPWFGANADDARLPAHGIARSSDFEVVATHADDARTTAVFRLKDRSKLPVMFEGCELVVEIELGRTLRVALVTTNSGFDTVHLTQALHTYFRISDIADVSIAGLDTSPYADALDGFSMKRQAGPVRFHSEVDRIYSVRGGLELMLQDGVWKRGVEIATEGSRSAVVWNPWIEKSKRLGDMGPDGYRQMVCIETANAGSDVVRVEPGNVHRLS
ncbi:MAG: D-hexose-6-phosphate mutarotase, partial [Pseudomonadota bacterium]